MVATIASAWGSISLTCGSSVTPICRTRARAITRRSAAPAATDCPPIRSPSTAPATSLLRRRQIEESTASDEQKHIDRLRLNALVALCESPRCRRQTLLGYFGETTPPCGNCDVCGGNVVVVDRTIAAQKAMSAILRTGERFGTEHLVNLLLGEETEAIKKFGHDVLPTFGVGKEHSRNEWRSIFRQLYAAGILVMDITHYGRWTVPPAGRVVLRGQAKIELRSDPATVGKKAARKAAAAAALAEGGESDQALFHALRARRSALARTQAVPAYVILPDRSLLDMARRKPATLAEMADIHGVGETKLARYGTQFLEVIREHRTGKRRRRRSPVFSDRHPRRDQRIVHDGGAVWTIGRDCTAEGVEQVADRARLDIADDEHHAGGVLAVRPACKPRHRMHQVLDRMRRQPASRGARRVSPRLSCAANSARAGSAPAP